MHKTASQQQRVPEFLSDLSTLAGAIFKDPGVFLLLVVAPLLYGLFYPLPYLKDRAEQVPIAVIDQEGGSYSRQLIRWMEASPRLHVVGVYSSQTEAEHAWAHTEVRGMIWLPSGWERDLLKGLPVTLPAAGDGASFLVARESLMGFSEVTGTLSAGLQMRRIQADGIGLEESAVMRDPLRMEVMRPYNPTESYLHAVFISVVILILQQTLWLGLSMASATQREKKTPLSMGWTSLLSTWLLCGSLYLLHAMILTGPVFSALHLPLPNDRSGAIFFLILVVITWVNYALLLCHVFRNRESGPALWVGTSLPILFLSGAIWPVEAMPLPLSWMAMLFPSTPAIQGMLQLWVYGASTVELHGVWEVLLPQFLISLTLLFILDGSKKEIADR